MTALYQLAKEYLCALDESCGAWIEEVEQAHDSLESRSAQLVMGMRCIDAEIDLLGAEIDRLGAEIDRLKHRAARLKSRRDGIGDYVRRCMGLAGLQRIRTALITAWVQLGAPRVEIVDIDLVPEQYLHARVPPPKQADKVKIRECIARGAVVPGAIVVRGEVELRVK